MVYLNASVRVIAAAASVVDDATGVALDMGVYHEIGKHRAVRVENVRKVGGGMVIRGLRVVPQGKRCGCSSGFDVVVLANQSCYGVVNALGALRVEGRVRDGSLNWDVGVVTLLQVGNPVGDHPVSDGRD